MALNKDWLAFLTQENAQIENNSVTGFSNTVEELRAAEQDDILCDLSHLGFISASGEEAESFLQNQLSNDIKKVNESHSQLNTYCTAKGRALSLFRTFKRDNDYYLQLPVDRIEATLKRLRMFVLMTKVTLEDASDKLVAFGIAGPNAQTLLASIVNRVPTEDNQCFYDTELLACKIPGKVNRYMILANTDKAIDAWKKLAPDCKPCGHAAWTYLDIHAGLPQIYEANAEAFVPQMLNLHNLDGISFQKGCYPGQEVVARMHFLGKLKRRMYLAHVDSDTPPAVGDFVFAKDDDTKEGIGKVVDSQTNPEGGYDLLTVLQIASAEQGPLFLNSATGSELKLLELPYTVTLEREDKPNTKL
ncbi:CAF17-like 4Fe-4S cluster assembly/insertion protein YgfZ [Kaarinaea lacus]